jgi:uroporphyrin-III C-methyltransferase
MRDEVKSGVLVVGHGSRRQEANEDVREAARRIAERGGFPLVEAAFLEIEHPNIGEGFARLVQRGAREITVHPYFLSPGRHTRGDIPVEVEEAAKRHIGVNYQITEPLSAHRLVIAASVERIRETIGSQLENETDNESDIKTRSSGRHRAEHGTVYLVGAGPGDPGLLTVKARDLLESCDVIVYDYLVNPDLLGYVPDGAERIYVGKVGGGRQTPQGEINYLLIDRARRQGRVVRLKGGDPFLFGRGAEEAEALRSAGIPFEVVPGISAALAVPAYAGIPLTHRDLSSSVAVLTGSRAGDGALARSLAAHSSTDTIVILMGVTHLRQIASDLIAAGRSGDTPTAVIRWGTYDAQQTIVGTLSTIADQAKSLGMRSPAVIVVGEVVTMRERLNWFENSFRRSVLEDLGLAVTAAG